MGVPGGWQQNTIISAQTGPPLTIVSGADNDFNGVGGDFADYRGGPWELGSRSKEDQILRWFDTSQFAANTIGTIGSGRRGQIRAPGDWNIDYSIFKNFKVMESHKLQFRAELFNALNHANLGQPNVTVNSPTFGLITSASAPRIGVKPGFTYGSTDEFGYHAAEDPVRMADFHATILHLLGVDYNRLSYKHDTREEKLTDVHQAKVVSEILT